MRTRKIFLNEPRETFHSLSVIPAFLPASPFGCCSGYWWSWVWLLYVSLDDDRSAPGAHTGCHSISASRATFLQRRCRVSPALQIWSVSMTASPCRSLSSRIDGSIPEAAAGEILVATRLSRSNASQFAAYRSLQGTRLYCASADGSSTAVAVAVRLSVSNARCAPKPSILYYRQPPIWIEPAQCVALTSNSPRFLLIPCRRRRPAAGAWVADTSGTSPSQRVLKWTILDAQGKDAAP